MKRLMRRSEEWGPRSPRGDLAATSTGLLRALDVEKTQLQLDERVLLSSILPGSVTTSR
jgi:hypothetical protein